MFGGKRQRQTEPVILRHAFAFFAVLILWHPAGAGDWVFKSRENESFAVSGPQLVRYGAAPNWVQKSVSGTIYCRNSFFGSDPAAGVPKHCEQWIGEAPSPVPSPLPTPAPAPTMSSCLLPDVPVVSREQRGLVKFEPGHFVHVAQRKGADFVQQVLNEIGTSGIKGIVRRYSWSDIETSQNNYFLGQIRRDLEYAAGRNKKLIVFIQYKYKNENDGSVVPGYLTADPSKKYYYNLDGPTPGRLANFGKPFVVERFLLLLKKIAIELDAHPHLAGIMFNETAMSVGSLSPTEAETFWAGLLRMDKAAACLFRATPVFQTTNFPVRLLGSITTAYKSHGVGMSTADILTNEPTLKGDGNSYSYFSGVGMQSPTAALIATSNYKHDNYDSFQAAPASVTNGLTPAESVSKLANFAISKLNVHYVFWSRLEAADPYYQVVIQRGKARSLPALRSTCPNMYRCH